MNNLGIFEPWSFDEITDSDWFRFFETNVLRGIRLSRHYLTAMRRRDEVAAMIAYVWHPGVRRHRRRLASRRRGGAEYRLSLRQRKRTG